MDKIHLLSPAGRYVVIDEDEFFEAFPEGCEKTYDELDRVLSVLKNGGFIDLKYARGDMYCVAPLKKYVEDKPDAPASPRRAERKINYLFLSAFAGSALGSFIISLIFALL